MELDQELYDYLLAVSLMETEVEEAENAPPAPVGNKTPADPGPKRRAARDSCAERRAPPKEKGALSPVDPSWELIDPTPNIHALFFEFDREYFFNSLGSVSVSWSSRMTLCAGICSYRKHSSCQIRLSLPLLKLRPRKDLVETLLHEMIHAYLFLHSRERESHGPLFHQHMRRINGQIGSNITVYHTFDQEVSVYKRHWWRCNGRCQNQKPFFGFVKRSMNRAPSKNDTWWAAHQASCGGTFIKIREPKDESKKTSEAVKKHGADIRSFLPPQEGGGAPAAKVARVEKEPVGRSKSIPADPDARFPGKGQTLGGSSGRNRLLELYVSRTVAAAKPPPAAPRPPTSRPSAATKPPAPANSHASAAAKPPPPPPPPAAAAAPKPLHSRAHQPPLTSPPRQCDIRSFLGASGPSEPSVTCPCCAAEVPSGRINEHLDACLS